MVRLDAETKQITHAIRMAAYNAETILARALDGHYARARHEAYALIREALATSGDICPGPGQLLVRLDPLTAPRRTQALAALYGDGDDVAWFNDHIEAGVTYANRPQGATTGAWPGYQPFGGWKGSSSTGKAIASFHYLAQYLREQSQTVVE